MKKHAEAVKELFPSSSVTVKLQLPDVFDLTADRGPIKPKRKWRPVHSKPSSVTIFFVK